jgi:lanthionine synthetase-like protein
VNGELRVGWLPLPLVRSLREAGRAIVADLERAPPFQVFGPDVARSLGEGDAGIAWLEAALTSRAGAPRGGRAHPGPASRRSRGSLRGLPLDRTLGLGRPGIVVLRARLGDRGGPGTAGLDRELAAILEHGAVAPGLFDGAAGVGVYALARPPRAGRRLARAFWRWLDRSLAAWPAPGAHPLLAGTSGHGWAGAAAVAARLVVSGLGGRGRRRGDASGAALGRRLLAAIGTRLADGAREWQGTGWWKGALGTSVALGYAGRALGDPALAAAARRLAEEAARAPTEPMPDACLGFGAAGRAHLLRRWHEATGARRFRDAAIAWYRRALALRGDRGPGGFLYSQGGAAAHERPGLWLGAAGIALALLSATGDARDDWDLPFLGALVPGPPDTRRRHA